MVVVFVVGVLGLFAADVIRDFTPVKLGGLFFFLFWLPLIAIHELGHAIMAQLFGCHVHRIVIGYGRVLGRFQFRGADLEVRMFPVEGFVSFREWRQPLTRLQRALVYFAGPGAELVILAVVVVVVGPTKLLTQSDSIAMIAAQSLCVCILLGALFNLIPHSSPRAGAGPCEDARTPNDGLGIVLSLLGRDMTERS